MSAGYESNPKREQERLEAEGYVKDHSLSTKKDKVYYSPYDKKAYVVYNMVPIQPIFEIWLPMQRWQLESDDLLLVSNEPNELQKKQLPNMEVNIQLLWVISLVEVLQPRAG